MLSLPGKLLRAVSDVTVGTAIVMVHVMLADRERLSGVAARSGLGPNETHGAQPRANALGVRDRYIGA